MAQETLETRALDILYVYDGSNNYILELKRRSEINRKF
jgi:hypothetical protein